MDADERFKKHDEGITSARALSRDVVHKILLFSAGALSLSVTMFSAFPTNVDTRLAQWSWYVLIGTVVIGYLTLFLHGRVLYAKEWKLTNTDFSISIKGYPFFYRFAAVPFALFSIIFPANMIFNRPNSLGKSMRQKINHYTVHELAWIEHRIPFLENLTVLGFIAGLILLVKSVQF